MSDTILVADEICFHSRSVPYVSRLRQPPILKHTHAIFSSRVRSLLFPFSHLPELPTSTSTILTTTAMKFSRAFVASTLAASASAFAPSRSAFVPRSSSAAAVAANNVGRLLTREFQSSTSFQANVLKLSEPQSELLDKVDIFIFDCDGVIWRVRFTRACRTN